LRISGVESFAQQPSIQHDLLAFPRRGVDNDTHFLAKLLVGDVSDSFLKVGVKTLGVRSLIRHSEAEEWLAPHDDNDETITYYRNSKQWIAKAKEALENQLAGFDVTKVTSNWDLMQSANAPIHYLALIAWPISTPE